jgi:ubiquitin-protein ligase
MKYLILAQSSITEEKGFTQQMGTYVTPSNNKLKMDRIAMELGTIASSLPCESSNSIFLRYDSQRMDVMRSVIMGASGTPYAHGAFLYNLYFGDDYP